MAVAMISKAFLASIAVLLNARAENNPPQYDAIVWKSLVTGASCAVKTQLTSKGGMTGGTITCTTTSDGIRHVKFPAGEFDIDEQVAIPANTVIEGNANPNDPLDKRKKPDPSTQTYFIATKGVTDSKAAYCGTHRNMQQGDAQKLRVGFLLNSNTVVKNINFQGMDTTRPDDNGNLCGGGAFETPGCVSPGFGDGVGYGFENQRVGCYDHTGQSNDLITGDGKGVENVTIDSVRLNDLLLPSDPNKYKEGKGNQLAVWVAMTRDGSATKNVKVTNLVSMLLRGDGINLHGNVQDSIVEDCHIENTGDDIYAMWGAYAENPTGNVFRNNVGWNPGATRDYWYGVCVAVYGAKDVTFTGTKCYDVRNWNHKRHSNSCLAYVHDNWFGAIYPEGNTINMLDNEYFYMDAPTEQIPDSYRPMIRSDSGSNAHIITGPTPSPTPFSCSSKKWAGCHPAPWTGSCEDHLHYAINVEGKSCDSAIAAITSQCGACKVCTKADCPVLAQTLKQEQAFLSSGKKP